MKGPYKFTPDEGPGSSEETYNKWGKGGAVIEGSFERKRREASQQAKGKKAVDEANDAYQRQQEAQSLWPAGAAAT